MNYVRKSLAVVLLLALSLSRPTAATAGSQIAVAVSSNAPAFEEAVAAFRIALGEDGALVFFVPLDNKEPAKSLFAGAERPRAAVAFGSRAFEAFASADPAVPLVVSMVLSTDSAGGARPQQRFLTVSLSVSPTLMLPKLRSAFPNRKKLAVLVSPGSSSLRTELSAVAQRFGYTLEIIECATPRDVLETFAALRGRVDFVWCLPDNILFPSAAIPPIILASIRNQLPVIGFSEGLVRAGAAVGFYPDYADIGAQTAEMVKRVLAKQEIPHVETPRKVRMAVNDRVLRILGIERANLSKPDPSNEVLVIH